MKMKGKTLKKLGAGFLSVLCAFSMLGSSMSGVVTASAASSTENSAFPAVDTIVKKAATLLGSPYTFGNKGYSGIYNLGDYSALSVDYINSNGIDCSGLVYYTLTQLGYSTTGFSFQNPVPVDTDHWLSIDSDCTITYGGVTSKVDIEKKDVPTESGTSADRKYWECTDYSTITPGSVVIAENPNGTNHAWIYIGEFDSRSDVIAYLKDIGVDSSLINSSTVGDGSGDGGTHWRIEANSTDGVVVNNNTDCKYITDMTVSVVRIAQNTATFTIEKVKSDDPTVTISGTSKVDGSVCTYGVYSDKACTSKVGTITIGTDGTGSIELPNDTYYVKELTAPTGYDLSTEVYKLVANDTVTVTESPTRGSITVNKTSEDNIVEGIEFKVTGSDGSSYTKTTDSSGVAKFSNLDVYDTSTGKAITYTVTEVDVETRYESVKAQNVTLTDGDADYTVDVDFVNELKKGNIKIVKVSEDDIVEGFTFQVTGSNGSTYTGTTNSKGVATITDLPVYASDNSKIVYTIKELNIPIRYITPDSQTAKLTADETTTVTFENELKKGDIKIVKNCEDSLEEGLTFSVVGSDGSSYTATTDADGIAIVEQIPVYDSNNEKIVYTVEETNVPIRYVVPDGQECTLTPDGVSTLTFTNRLKKFRVEVTKYDVEEVTITTSELVGDVNGDGEVTETDLNLVKAYVSGSGELTDEQFERADVNGDGKVTTADVGIINNVITEGTNTTATTTITVPSDTGTPQGDATLAGAVYGIYQGGELVDTYTTDKDGKFTTDYYVCDTNWTIKEITPSEGYLLDETVYEVGADPKLYTVEYNTTSNDVVEQVIKGKIAIIKHTDDGSTQIETPEEGATFEVYLKSSGSYDNAKETERDILVCDEDGFAETIDLPYGVYTVHQTSGWEGKELMSDFDVYIADDGKTYKYLINNATFESYVQIIKTDEETGKTVPYAGAGFQIYDPDGNLVTMTYTYPSVTTIDTFYTDSEGKLITPEELEYGKGYSIVEVQAPYGYVLDSTPVYFDITEDNATEVDGVTVIQVTKTNMPQKGTITVTKTGEVFTTVSVSGDDLVGDVNGDGVVNDTDVELANSYAKGVSDLTEEQFERADVNGDGNVTTADVALINSIAQGVTTTESTEETTKTESASGNYTFLEGAVLQIIDSEGTVIDEWTTTSEGHYLEGILIAGATYTLHEVSVPAGYVVADDIEFTVSTDGRVDYVTMVDDTTKVSITKTDITSGDELPGAELQIIDSDGNVIDSWTSTEDAHYIEAVLTAGETYTLVETKPADGYATAESISFTIENTSDIQEVVMEDDVTKVEISKTDITNGEEIPGAELVVTDDDGNVIDEWISTDEPHVITGLTVDETYTLTETCPADGYVTAEDIEFTISDTGEIQTVEMKDDVTKVEISKVDSEGNYVAGAELQILDSEGEVIAEFTSSDEAYYIEKLIAGATYTLHEVSAPDGYELSDDVEFTVEDTAEIQYVSMVDEETPKTVTTETTETTTDTPTTTTTTTTTTESTPNTGSGDNGLAVLFVLAVLFAIGFVGTKARAFKRK